MQKTTCLLQVMLLVSLAAPVLAQDACGRPFRADTVCGNPRCGVCDLNRKLYAKERSGQYKFTHAPVTFRNGETHTILMLETFDKDGVSTGPRQPFKWKQVQEAFLRKWHAKLAEADAAAAAARPVVDERCEPFHRVSPRERKLRLEPATIATRLVGFDASDGRLTDEELGRAFGVLKTAADQIREVSSYAEAVQTTRYALHTHYQLRGYRPYQQEQWTKWPMEVSRFKWFEQFDLRTVDNPLEPALHVGFMGTPHAVAYTTIPYRVIRPDSSKKVGYEVEDVGVLEVRVFKDNPRKKVFFRIRNIGGFSGKYK